METAQLWARRGDGDGAALEQMTVAAISPIHAELSAGAAGCFLCLTGRVVGPQRAHEEECLGSAAPLDANKRQRLSDCRQQSRRPTSEDLVLRRQALGHERERRGFF
jgi:hypothetical protein